jgi:hypothetical protein
MATWARGAVAGILEAAVVLAAAPLAVAQSPLDEYQRTGQVSPCGYSVERLSDPLDSDMHQYAREFETAVGEAAREGCVAGGVALTPARGRPGGPAGALRPTEARDEARDGEPTWPAPLAGLALAMVAILIGAVVAAGVRWGSWGSGRRGPVGHAFRQIGLTLGSRVGAAAGSLRRRPPGG